MPVRAQLAMLAPLWTFQTCVGKSRKQLPGLCSISALLTSGKMDMLVSFLLCKIEDVVAHVIILDLTFCCDAARTGLYNLKCYYFILYINYLDIILCII